MLILYKCPKLILEGAVETSLGAVLAEPLTMLTVNLAIS
jgi:hypothetical protein